MMVNDLAVADVHGGDGVHLFFRQEKIENIQILCHSLCMNRLRYRRHSSLKMPPQNDLRRCFPMLLPYFKQGVALLPYNRQSYTKFKYLSAKILEMGGEASIVEMKFLDPKDEREVVSRFRTQALEELSQLKQDCAQVLSELKNGGAIFTEDQSEQVKKMIRRYSKARSRNHFGLSTAQDVEKGLYAIISTARQASSELSAQLAKAMDKAVK